MEKCKVWMMTPIGRMPVEHEGKKEFSREEAEKLKKALQETFPAEKGRFVIECSVCTTSFG